MALKLVISSSDKFDNFSRQMTTTIGNDGGDGQEEVDEKVVHKQKSLDGESR